MSERDRFDAVVTVRSVRLRLTKRTGAIPWQVYPGDRH